MTYAVFKYEPNCDANFRIKKLALLFLTPESKFSGCDSWHSSLNTKKMSSNKIDDFAGYLSCCEAKVPSVSIIKFDEDLESDEYLRSLGDSYIGCIQSPLVKKDLITRVEMWLKLEKNNGLIHRYDFEVISPRKNLEEAYLSYAEIAEFNKVHKSSVEIVEKWINERRVEITKSIKKLPKFLKRDF